jgi:hypothetical protein
MQTQLATATDAFDLSSEQTVLEYTQSSEDPVLCRVSLAIGDDDKPLDGTGGDFTVEITVDDVAVYSYPATVTLAATTTKALWQSEEFMADAGAEVAVLLTSPNAGDSDVNVTASIYGQDVSSTYENLTSHMTGAVEICNMAIGHLGEITEARRLTSMSRSAASGNAQHACLDFYEESKRQMLAFMQWECCNKVAKLTVSDDDPTLNGQWAYKYTRPADCLILRKIIDSSGNEYPWTRMNEAREGTAYNDDWIYTNLEDALALYTFRVGEEKYLPGMALLQSVLLAEMIAMTIVADAKKALMITQKLQLRVERLAQALGATEGYVEEEGGSKDVTGVF